MSEWKDIVLAPRDGERILAWAADWQSPQAVYWDESAGEDNPDFEPFWAYCEDLIADVAGCAEPTHWQPLRLPRKSTTP